MFAWSISFTGGRYTGAVLFLLESNWWSGRCYAFVWRCPCRDKVFLSRIEWSLYDKVGLRSATLIGSRIFVRTTHLLFLPVILRASRLLLLCARKLAIPHRALTLRSKVVEVDYCGINSLRFYAYTSRNRRHKNTSALYRKPEPSLRTVARKNRKDKDSKI